MTFSFTRLSISEIVLIEPKLFHDTRGYFHENFKESEFSANGINLKFVQDNMSFSTKGVLRGLHFQKEPKGQAKLISVISGEIFDVAVDLRKDSKTFGKWISQILSNQNHKMLYIPEGFAHGFCTLSDTAHVLYKTTNEYSFEHEQGIIWNDPDVLISWPIQNPLMSEKDKRLPTLQNL
jgi:dTDP-4-dehydrorhamnose 3,5-epimerase